LIKLEIPFSVGRGRRLGVDNVESGTGRLRQAIPGGFGQSNGAKLGAAGAR